ncbi:MAG: N-acetylmuramoyl-L-alanine amidase [Rhodospirillaceae bacterium]
MKLGSIKQNWDIVRRTGALTVILLLGAFVWSPLPGGVAKAADIAATEIRLGDHRTKTRFVLDLSDKVDFKIFTLVDPYRVVIDLPDIKWRVSKKSSGRKTGLISGFRYGNFRPGRSRVVLDTAKPAKVLKASLLPPAGGKRYRLVIDLVATNPAGMLTDASATPPSEPAVQQTARAGNGLQVDPPGRKPKKGRKTRKVVVIDPGHGGVDPGAIGGTGIFEKKITLAVAKQMKQHLEKLNRYTVYLTRSNDKFVRLRERIAIARAKGADLFISLHADAIKSRKVSGTSVYTLSERASDKEAAALAEHENKADLIAGMDLNDNPPEVTNILIDLAQRESMNESSTFAGDLVNELRKVTKLLRRSHRFAGFAVLKAPDVPSVLIELGFLSNPKDEKALRNPEHRARLAGALGKAIDTYFDRVEQANRY